MTTHISSINISWFYTLPVFLFSRSFPFCLNTFTPQVYQKRAFYGWWNPGVPTSNSVWKFVALLVGCLLLSRALVPGLCSLNTRKRHRFPPKAITETRLVCDSDITAVQWGQQRDKCRESLTMCSQLCCMLEQPPWVLSLHAPTGGPSQR